MKRSNQYVVVGCLFVIVAFAVALGIYFGLKTLATPPPSGELSEIATEVVMPPVSEATVVQSEPAADQGSSPAPSTEDSSTTAREIYMDNGQRNGADASQVNGYEAATDAAQIEQPSGR